MMAANMAPGMNREFLAEEWKNLIPKKCWYEAMDEANDLVKDDISVDIQGYDIDGEIVRAARAQCGGSRSGPSDPFPAEAGEPAEPSEEIRLRHHKPATGEAGGQEGPSGAVTGFWRERSGRLDSWSAYMITSYEDAERYFGRKAQKNRKIYNGMLKTYFYQFLGPKPPKKLREK